MARFCSLFSGSSGNCTYIGSGDTGILIDAGVSAKRIETALRERDLDPAGISAVFVTHEHSDHIQGLRVLAHRYGYRIYATGGTLWGVCDFDEKCSALPLNVMTGPVTEGALTVTAFATSHDSSESCGYRIHTADGRTLAVATDTGVITPALREALTGCDLVLMEANHDVTMLKNGPYPFPLKQRILSDTGHLSNEACAAELAALVQSGTTRIVLGHLSRENNRPMLAQTAAQTALSAAGLQADVDYLLRVAAPNSAERVMLL